MMGSAGTRTNLARGREDLVNFGSEECCAFWRRAFIFRRVSADDQLLKIGRHMQRQLGDQEAEHLSMRPKTHAKFEIVHD